MDSDPRFVPRSLARVGRCKVAGQRAVSLGTTAVSIHSVPSAKGTKAIQHRATADDAAGSCRRVLSLALAGHCTATLESETSTCSEEMQQPLAPSQLNWTRTPKRQFYQSVGISHLCAFLAFGSCNNYAQSLSLFQRWSAAEADAFAIAQPRSMCPCARVPVCPCAPSSVGEPMPAQALMMATQQQQPTLC